MVYENQRVIKDYPVYTVSGLQINNETELEQWFLNWHEKHNFIYYYDFSCVARWDFIFDNKIDEWIVRYNLLKSNNIQSYSNVFDELPAIWIQGLDVITTELAKAAETKGKK